MINPSRSIERPDSISIRNTTPKPTSSWSMLVDDGLNIFSEILRHIANIRNNILRNRVKRFINSFNLIIMHLPNSMLRTLPTLKLDESTDVLVKCEWVFQYMRLGFNLEEDSSESYWYLVAKDNYLNIDINVSGDFNDDVMVEILKIIVPMCIEGAGLSGARVPSVFSSGNNQHNIINGRWTSRR